MTKRKNSGPAHKAEKAELKEHTAVKRAAKRGANPSIRKCLRCGKSFKSRGIENRLCTPCYGLNRTDDCGLIAGAIYERVEFSGMRSIAR